jgi:hypothetical protein
VWLFRRILQQLFVWRLNIEGPEIIKIGLDTMVLDNDDSKMKEGVEPTYKKVKGFQPLQFLGPLHNRCHFPKREGPQ